VHALNELRVTLNLTAQSWHVYRATTAAYRRGDKLYAPGKTATSEHTALAPPPGSSTNPLFPRSVGTAVIPPNKVLWV